MKFNVIADSFAPNRMKNRPIAPESASASPTYLMPLSSFSEWLGNRSQEAPAADRLAALIASAPGGISADRLRRLCGLPPEALADVLRALVATGQVNKPTILPLVGVHFSPKGGYTEEACGNWRTPPR